MQSERRRQDDEEHYQIGKERPDTDVNPSVQNFCRSCAAPLDEGVSANRLFLLDFLRGLPKEEIGTDRSSEDCHKRCPRGATLRESGKHRRVQNRAPVRVKTE